MSVEDTVREFIVTRFEYAHPEHLTPTYELVENDVIDSMGVFETVKFVERHFEIEIDDEELVPENFETIESITRLVESKLPD